MFYINEMNENMYFLFNNLTTDLLNSVEYINFNSMSTGGTAYIYETVSYLYSGYLNVSMSDFSHNAQLGWADILSFIVSTSAADILEEIEAGELFDLDDAIVNSFIVSYVTRQDNGMCLFFNAPTLFVLENPELIDDAGGTATDFFLALL